MRHIPNIFTLLNLFFGCLANVFALQTESIIIYQGDDLVSAFNIPEELSYAALCIGIAAVIDFLDGFIARLFNATSALGKQLDSLSDVVSFGVAPAVILYQFLRLSFMQQENALERNTIWLMPAFLFAVAGAYRLARFNIDTKQDHGFKGVPIPAAGLVVASLPLIAHYNYFDGAINALLFNKWVLYGLILLLSYLMVSRLPFMALKVNNRGMKNNLPQLFMVLIAVIAAILFKWMAVPIAFLCYIALSLLFKNRIT